MRRRLSPAILSAAAVLVLLWHVEESSAQTMLAAGADAEVTEDGLHRVDPSIMEAAWVKPDLDLSRYTRILLVPTAVLFRDVPERGNNARTRIATEEFRLTEQKKEWLRGLWRRAVEAEFAQEKFYESYQAVDSDVLVVQAFLVDVVSSIPPDSVGSSFTLVRDPWSATVILELRDATTAELVARTVDRRNAQGLLEIGEAWYRTEELIERWAEVLSERLEQLTNLSGRGSRTPAWAR
jgi:hypothetical protein